jgi:hypothetical protein
MNFEVSIDTNLLENTCYQNSIVIAYDKIVELFGQPIKIKKDERSTVEWIIKWEDGTITAIYDWYSSYLDIEKVTDWHIGGLDKNAAHYLYEYIKST